MEKAKAAVSDFMSKAGKHDTTVHEKVAPGVTHETVKPTRHENLTTAVDKEIHQDHYHHSVQPVHDREVLPEKHRANLGAVEHRDFDHRDQDTVTRNLETERAKFKDERVVHDTRHTQSAQPTVAGEHVHHHVHETIQPVIHKETIQPEVVHTTVPIHEVHHNAAQHHSTSELPPVSLSEFKKQGGVLTGREERYDEFKGEPRNIGGALGSHTHKKTDSVHDHHHNHGEGLTGNTGTTRDTGIGAGNGLNSTSREHHTTGNTLGNTARTGELGTGAGAGAGNTLNSTTRDHHSTGNTLGNNTRAGEFGIGNTLGNATHGTPGNTLGSTQHSTADKLGNTTQQRTGTTTGQQASLSNKLNPLTDSDRDGRRGVAD